MIEPRASFVTGSAGLKNYLLKSTKELNAISGRVSHGETVDLAIANLNEQIRRQTAA